MRARLVYVFMAASVLLLTQCKKDNGGGNVTPAVTKDYLPMTTGSTFTYNDTTNGVPSVYTLTATGTTTTMFGKTYSIFSGSDSINRYRAKTGTNYYQVASLSALRSGQFEDNYLNDSLPLNSTWTTSFKIVNVLGFPDSLTAVATYQVAEKGITKIVKGTIFTNVIHVALTDLSAYADTPPAGQLIGGIAVGDFYYALGAGLIQGNLDVTDVSSYGIPAYTSSQVLTSYHVK